MIEILVEKKSSQSTDSSLNMNGKVKSMGFKMERAMLICIIVMLPLFASCFDWREENQKVSGEGTICYIMLEGGFYGIVDENGRHYDPLNLPKDFRIDSLRVYFEGELRREIATFHMWGVPLYITHIEKL